MPNCSNLVIICIYTLLIMKCEKCGYPLKAHHYVCPNCGAYTNMDEKKKPSIILCIISVLIPPVGNVLFLFMDNATPTRAKVYMKCALIGYAIYLLIIIGARLVIRSYINQIIDHLREVFRSSFN